MALYIRHVEKQRKTGYPGPEGPGLRPSSAVIEGRKGEAGRADLERLLQPGLFEIVSVTPHMAEIAIGAFRRYGKGRHRAGLNIGDCFSYALAAALDEPLLFKGNDFIHTDIRPAVPRVAE